MLTLSSREAMLGAKHSGNTVERDGAQVKQLTFELAEVMLDASELNCLLGEPHAHNSLYNHSRDGVRPFLKCFRSLELLKGIDGAFVQLTWSACEFSFVDCKLSKVKLELREGGETALSCKVTCAPALDETLAELFDKLGAEVSVELRAEPPTAQQDLPLNTHGTDEQPETGKRKRRNGSRPAAH